MRSTRIRHTRTHQTVTITAVVFLSVTAQTVRADTINWGSSDDGEFGDPQSWTGPIVPDADDVAVFDGSDDSYDVTFDLSPVNQGVIIDNNDGRVTFRSDGNARTYSITGAGGTQSVQVGNESLLRLDGSTGEFTLTIGDELLVGDEELQVRGGADVTAERFTLTGGTEIIDAGSTLTVMDSTTIGGALDILTDGSFRSSVVSINSGRILIDGGSADLGTLHSSVGPVGIDFRSGSLSIRGDLTVDSTPTTDSYLGGDIELVDRHLELTGTTTIESTGSLRINGGSLTTGSLRNLAGGNLAFESGMLRISGTSGINFGLDFSPFDGPFVLGPGKTLHVDWGLSIGIQDEFVVDGGMLSASAIRVLGSASFDIGAGGFNNTSEIELVVNSRISGGVLTNQGLIHGTGRIESDLVNEQGGELRLEPASFGQEAHVSGGVLTNRGLIRGSARIDAVLVNETGGDLRFEAGDNLEVSNSGNTNAGRISSLGGKIEFARDLRNLTDGRIDAANATVRLGDGLVNDGQVSLLGGGQNHLFADVVNNAGARISVAGASTANVFGNMTNNGDIFVGSESRLVLAGTTDGAGTYSGSGIVEFVDGFSPGNSPAAVYFGGDVVFGAGTVTTMEISGFIPGSEHDQINAAGEVKLGGTLEIVTDTADGSYTDPSSRGEADLLELITAGELEGSFRAVYYDGAALAPTSIAPDGSFHVHVGDGLFRDLTYTESSLRLVNYLAPAGDANGDLVVDDLDFEIWNVHRFTSDTDWMSGDFNGDGFTDVSDFHLWNENRGIHVASQSVPEPAGMMFVLSSICAAACKFRPRKHFLRQC